MDNENKNRGFVNWEKRCHDLLNSLNIGFILADIHYSMKDFNEQIIKMTGFTREQLEGRNIREMITQDEFQRNKQIVDSLREKGMDDYQYEAVLPCANGDRIPVLINSHINRDSNGEIESINVMITDIREQKYIQNKLAAANKLLQSNQKSLENEKKMIETILFGIGDCVTLFDPDGNFMLCNPRGLEIRGQHRFPLLKLDPGNHKPLILEVDGDQREFIGRIEGIKDEDGEIFAFVEILQDITYMSKFKQQEQELIRMKRQIRRKELEFEMVGVSNGMQNIFDLISRCADVDFDILLLGETGVGKEMVARAIHANSARKDKPFVTVNCGALPETLFESELFGNVKGAFTGATSERPGLFREAQGGVIFLDEIGDISKNSQVKLLRVLEEREVRPLGSGKSYPVDLRVVTATNRDLKELVDQGLFRSDLYYRISVIPLSIPPLRERKDDILPLAEYFIKTHQTSQGERLTAIDHTAQKLLLEYRWPGNIRELENCIKHAITMGNGQSITMDQLPVQVLLGQNQLDKATNRSTEFMLHSRREEPLMETNPKEILGDLSQKILEADKESIRFALRRHRGSRSLAAKYLGISRTTLWRKIKIYQLTD